MWNNLVGNPSIVLEDVVVHGIACFGNFLCNWEKLGKLIIGDLVEPFSVEFGDHELPQ